MSKIAANFKAVVNIFISANFIISELAIILQLNNIITKQE